MTSTSISARRRCAACSYSHKPCPETCDGANMFPDIISQNDYDLIFQVYGVTTILKILKRCPTDLRHDCIHSLLFEARSRMDNPAHGCSSRILALEHMVEELRSRVIAMEAIMEEKFINVASGPSSVVKGGYMDLLMAAEKGSPVPHSVHENPPPTVENFTVPTLSPYLNMLDYQASMTSYSQLSEIGVSGNSQGEIPQVSPQIAAEPAPFNAHSSVQTSHLVVDISHFRPAKRQRLEQTNLSFTEEDLNRVEFPQDVGGNPIDLSSVGFDADDFWDFGTDRGDASRSLMDQPSPGLEFDSLWDIGMDTNGAHGIADIAERSSEETETLPSPLIDSKGKAPMVD